MERTMPRPPPDLARLSRARDGDREALRELAEGWWPTMRRWAYLELGDRTLAEDACQDALVRLVRFVDRVDPDRPFGTWLRAVVRNCCHDLRARRRRLGEREAPAVDRGRVLDLDRQLDLDRAARRAVAAFARLSPRQREILDLCDRQGLAPTEVARRLELAPGSVRAQLHAARRALRTQLPGVRELLEEP